jgi:hypothetical protein
MRTASRLVLLLAVFALTAGPTLSATALGPHEATITTPARAPSSGHPLLNFLAYGAAAFGAIQMRDLGTLAKKFSTRAQGAQGDYKTGVEGAGAAWEQGATAGEGNYEQGVQAAIGRKAFGKGIRAAGQQKYTANASKLGPQRYAAGVQNAEGAWQQGFAPVAQVIQSLALPPKGPKRSPQNQARANMVATALGAWKEGK